MTELGLHEFELAKTLSISRRARPQTLAPGSAEAFTLAFFWFTRLTALRKNGHVVVPVVDIDRPHFLSFLVLFCNVEALSVFCFCQCSEPPMYTNKHDVALLLSLQCPPG